MAKVNYLEQWASNLLSLRSEPLSKAARVDGVRRVHLGPRMEIAGIELLIEPADAFEVVVTASVLASTAERERFVEWAIFGFLDVAMVAESYPIKNVKVTVLSLHVDAVSSSLMAFRHAGRDAGRKFVSMSKER